MFSCSCDVLIGSKAGLLRKLEMEGVSCSERLRRLEREDD
jgi:hypothetical protein